MERMSVFDGMRARWAALAASDLQTRSDPDGDVSSVATALYDLIEDRLSAMSLEDARHMPPVVRAMMLLAGIGASLTPLAYREGVAMGEQPTAVLRPDPFGTRYDFVWQTIASLAEHGCAPWFLTNEGTRATVLAHDEVRHEWAPGMRGLQRQYVWRGRKLRDDEIKMVTIGRRAGELCGRGPLSEILQYLTPVKIAELWALAWFASGGLPDTVITAKDGDLSDLEAEQISDRWVERRAAGKPAVLPNSLAAAFTNIDPERAQLHQSRAYGNTIVATALGIPAALLHVQTTGASVTYSNAMAAVDELVKGTIGPSYLAPIAQAWSDLLPRPQAVRFDYDEMMRTDLVARSGVYKTLIDAGILTPDEPRAFEGWAPLGGPTEAAHAFDAAPPLEVPANV